MKIIGQPNCLLEITEGPIIIKINENYDNEVVKFSQVKLQFDTNLADKSVVENENTNSKLSFLFKIYPGSIVEIEDCDITCTRENSILKNKFICFLIKYCPFPEPPSDIISPNITILTIISSRIEKFYQTIRSGENCIINIEKSFINKNIGKPIAVLNPLIIKIVGTIFENNGDNAIHVKFIKDEILGNDSRKLYFNNNEFLYNNGCGIFIDGIENFLFDLYVTIDSNLFKRNSGDGIFFMDILAKSLLIKKNQFLCGKMNGLNLQKVYQKLSQKEMGNNVQPSLGASSTPTPNLEINENEFIENDGYGIFLSDTKAKISVNNFVHNGMGGILLVNITSNYNGNSNSGNSNMINYNSNVVDINSASKSGQTHGNTSSLVNSHNNISSYLYSSPGTTTLFKNYLFKNGGSGLKIVNYNNFVSVSECVMKENIEFGVCIEFDYNPSVLNANNKNTITDNSSTIMDKIKSFQNSDNSKIPKETNLFLHNSSLINNMKSGLSLNNSFAFLENTIINDNLDFSVYVPKQQFTKCYKISKNSNSNLINGNIGGPWGEISVSSRTLCSTCTSTTKIKRNKFNNDIQPEQNLSEKKKNLIENPNEVGPAKPEFKADDNDKNNLKQLVVGENKNSKLTDANVNRKQNSEDNDDNKCRIM